MQGALFATTNAGTDLARDIQTGFLNRLALTPMRSAALLLGQLAGVIALALLQATLYLTVGLIAGVRPESGVLGVFLIVFLGVLIALAFGAIGAFLALRTGSGEAIQALFPLFFVFLFLSSMNLPRNLIEIDWFRTVATINPVSLPDRRHPEPDHQRLGRGGARARLRPRRRDRRPRARRRQAWRSREGWPRS